MIDNSNQAVQADEKTLSGLAYLLGLIPAVLIWFLKKDVSPYIKFHAMQAAIYSGLVSLVAAFLLTVQGILAATILAGAFIGTNVIADTIQPESPLIFLVVSMIMIVTITVGFGIVAFFVFCLKLVNLIAAVFAFNGKDWRYPVLGNWVSRMTNTMGSSQRIK